MTTFRLARLLKSSLSVCAPVALVATLSACGPDDGEASALGPAADVQWPTNPLGVNGGEALAMPAMPEARPMIEEPPAAPARYDASYREAPAYYDSYRDDYARPDPAYYEQDTGLDSYAMLALAATLGSVLADSPPDYGFRYGDVEPWAWRTGDDYVRYAEPIRGGSYRTYYYAPGQDYPFLVRDPYYSYGYREDRVVVIYDRAGRVLDPHRARIQRRIGRRYFDRSRELHRAALRSHHRGVSAPRWARHRHHFAEAQRDWERKRRDRREWRAWDRRHEPALTARWSMERAARNYAGDRFSSWQKADYRGPAPRFYREARKNRALMHKVRAERARVYRVSRQETARRASRFAARGHREVPKFAETHARRNLDRHPGQVRRAALQRKAQMQKLRADRKQIERRRDARRNLLHRREVQQHTRRGSNRHFAGQHQHQVQRRKQTRHHAEVRGRMDARRNLAARQEQAGKAARMQAQRKHKAKVAERRQSRAAKAELARHMQAQKARAAHKAQALQKARAEHKAQALQKARAAQARAQHAREKAHRQKQARNAAKVRRQQMARKAEQARQAQARKAEARALARKAEQARQVQARKARSRALAQKAKQQARQQQARQQVNRRHAQQQAKQRQAHQRRAQFRQAKRRAQAQRHEARRKTGGHLAHN
ncbi:hypothetical protein [Novosphingobium malaysiense]|uniref:Lipoprotein n=1 Tax=Novosphingobium malaysiense TaxID=1348853 RepID=A0A0B1ZS69_9SPHN|nr:hypothetical protein [Novosphingobium malaysiense]KHK93451.1 hypothetical protein LK12_04065 [Novosphingobium malaysiense]